MIKWNKLWNIFHIRASYFTCSIVSYNINFAPNFGKGKDLSQGFLFFGTIKKNKNPKVKKTNQRKRHKTIKIRTMTCLLNGKGNHIIRFLLILIIIKVCQNRMIFPLKNSKFLRLLLNITLKIATLWKYY